MKIKRVNTKHSIIKRLSFILIIGWLLPVTIIYFFMTALYQNAIVNRTEDIIKENIKFITHSISTRLTEAIDISKNLSNEKNIEDSWIKYKNNLITFNKFSYNIRERLNINFDNDKRFNMSCFFLTEYPDGHYYTANNYYCYETYLESAYGEVLTISELDTSDIFIMIIDSNIYIIRNMYTLANYEKIGTLTLMLDIEALFSDINFEYISNTAIFINNTDVSAYSNEYQIKTDADKILNMVRNQYAATHNNVMTKINDRKYQAYLYESKYSDYHLGVYTIVGQRDNYKVLNELNLIIMLIWIVIVPIIAYLSRYVYKQINKPLTKVITAASRLEKGEIGVQIEDLDIPNIEFETLVTGFNKVSSELEKMIDYAYKEELVKKDAKIMALQSQINPHFLNNTLEMMNWQARLSGDTAVSKMIEALSTFLGQSMDRKNERLIPFSEVLRCSDAYYYITSMRFGKKLIFEKEVDESLLTALVPPLILQPILENAVTHGIENKKHGRIWLKVFRHVSDMVMQVINTGKTMTKEEIEHINNMLSEPYEMKNDKTGSHHYSLGIRNVNERIRLIYGDKYGLTIRSLEEGKTIAEIIIPICMP